MAGTKPKYILPEEACILREATRRACERARALGDLDREVIADSVLWLADCGYARAGDGTLDADMLAEAAVLQFWSRRAPPRIETAGSLW